MGGSAPSSSYGLYVNAQTAATHNYAATFMGGNVGIGTTSPAQALDVVGNIASSGTVSAANLSLVGVTGAASPSSGVVVSDANGHMNYSGTVPTLGACGAGAAPTIVGNDNVFTVTRGGTAGTTCAITFAKSWTNTPICIAMTNFSSTTYISAASTTAITITNTSNASGKIYVQCRGYL